MRVDCGERLLPQILDSLADTDPNRVYAAIPLSAQVSDGFQDITVASLANAVNRCCWWMQEKPGTSTTFDTIAYLGIADLRYAIVFLASVKCGRKVLLLQRLAMHDIVDED